MIWNIIRDFFVMYIFGGNTSNGDYIFDTPIGYIFGYSDNTHFEEMHYTTDLFFKLPNTISSSYTYEGDLFISIGDYLSTTATIITLVVLAIVVALGIRWLFRFLISRFTKWGL